MIPYVLMISEYHAHKLLSLINSVHSDAKICLISAIVVFIFAGCMGVGFYNTDSSIAMHICDVFAWLALLLMIISGFNYLNSFHSTSLILDGGATNNVGCYRQMQHLKHIYPHLRAHKKSLIHNSLTYDTSLTKPQAIKRYKILRRCYRNPNVNLTISTKPYTPKWWQGL